MTCKGCEKSEKLIKAHVIPESFFKGFRSEGGTPLLLSNIEGMRRKRSPIGVYDSSILCGECESRFQKIDEYGQHLLIRNEKEQKPLIQNGEVVGYEIFDVDYNILKLFFIGILWRASISGHQFYSKVNLGPHESIAKEILWREDAEKIKNFSFVLAKFDGEKLGKTMLDPHPERWGGINYYRFYLYGYTLYIKVDKRSTPEVFEKLERCEDGRFLIIKRDFDKSKELNVMKNIVLKGKI